MAAGGGGLPETTNPPFTTTNDLRATHDETHPIGIHLTAPMSDVVRAHSTNGTTGTPSSIPPMQPDLETWIEISRRSCGASGGVAGERMADGHAFV